MLIISTGVLILLVTLMTIVELERTTSKARVGSYQADLAVESGFEEAKMILAGATASDSYAIGVVPFAAEFDDNDDGTISSEEDGNLSIANEEKGRPYLYAIQGEVEGGGVNFRMTPLFATHEGPGTQAVNRDGELTLPTEPGLSLQQKSNLDNRVAVRGTPHIQAPVTAWRTIRDDEDIPIARYSYWVEDMQGYLDAEQVAGNRRNSGAHGRANEVWTQQVDLWNEEVSSIAEKYVEDGGAVPLWPAPGLNPAYAKAVTGEDEAVAEESLLSEIAVFTLDQSKPGVKDESDLDDSMRELAPKAPTPASLLALSGVEAPLERVPEGVERGRLELKGGGDPEPRWIEESFVTGNQSWEEFALIPFAPGLDPGVMGELRLNLNEKLEELEGATAAAGGTVSQGVVEEIADHIAEALPRFSSQRRGGFGDWQEGDEQDAAYLKTFAASLIDYADTDSVPTMDEDEYRGVDSHPFITEYLITHRIDGFEKRNGANFIVIEVETFAELWNMSNYPVTGNFELGYINPFVFEALGNPEIDFMTPLDETVPSSSQSWSSHFLTKDEESNRWYSTPKEVTIPANGYTLVSTGIISNHILVSPSGDFLPLPIELSILEREEVANYRLKWDDVLCDRSGGGLELTTMTLDLSSRSQVTKAVICGTWGEFRNFYSGMYDPRQSWWAGLDNEEGVVSENSYPQNYSPGRRTVRYGSIGRHDEDALHGRVLVSQWPDGGHDSSFELGSFHKAGSGTSDRALRPDSPDLYTEDIEAEPLKSPLFVSNLGRFFSESELGNVYDPHMWQHKSKPSNTQEIWYQGSASDSRNNNVPEVEVASKPSTVVGGGNTMRIGRPEHARFDEIGVRASHLLDLFHCGEPYSITLSEQTGDKRRVQGQVNVNTASREVLRSLVAGILATDPEICKQLNSFNTRDTFAPRTSDRFEKISATDAISGKGGLTDEGGAIADAIIASRPFVSRSQLASLIYPSGLGLDSDLVGKAVFGNKLNHDSDADLQMSDRAMEEVFSRVYNSTTVRSRNFRIHVIGQALEQTPSGNLRIKATRKKSYRVFVNPGEQNSEFGDFDPQQVTIETSYETNL
ncbi:MAG: hypothetical protein ACSHYB_10375 [Roseibacillus sp.]